MVAAVVVVVVVVAARGRGRRRVVIAVAVFLVSIAPVVDTVVAVVDQRGLRVCYVMPSWIRSICRFVVLL